jgi:hypothetical protein
MYLHASCHWIKRSISSHPVDPSSHSSLPNSSSLQDRWWRLASRVGCRWRTPPSFSLCASISPSSLSLLVLICPAYIPNESPFFLFLLLFLQLDSSHMLTCCPCPFLATCDFIFLLVLIVVLLDKGKRAKQSCTHLLRFVFTFFYLAL